MAAKKRKPPTIQIVEGTWYRLGHFGSSECCGCALVHDEEIKLENGVLWFRNLVDEAATKAARARRVANGERLVVMVPGK